MNRHAKASSSAPSMRQANGLGRIVRGALATRGASSRFGGSGAPSIGVSLRALIVSAVALIALALPAVASAAPAVTIEDASNVAYTTADVEGTVDPEGQPTSWRFQYATAADFSNAQDGPSGSTETFETLTGQLTGLVPATTYHLRLVAENGDGPSEAVAAGTFETKEVSKPTVTTPLVSAITGTSAHFSGEVTAGGTDPAFQTSCVFDYVDDISFQHQVNERLQLDIAAEGGTFTLEYYEPKTHTFATTAPIAFDAPASGPGSVQEALEALSNVPAGSVAVTGGPGDKDGSSPYIVEFIGLLGGSVEGVNIYPENLISTPIPHRHTVTVITDGVSGGFASNNALHAKCDPDSIGGTASTPVIADPSQLEPNTTYHVRLRAQNQGGSSELSATFATPGTPPLVRAFAAGPVSHDQADINGFINPRNSPTKYWFEWGTADCSANPCQKIPNDDEGADAGSGHLNVFVFRHLTGLQPATTYHFRLVAKNDSGPLAGDDQQFTTATAPPDPCANEGRQIEQHSTFLPDCRAYEMVSPADKNGTDVVPISFKTFAAEVGDGVSYNANGGLGDVHGTSITSQYLARRTAQPATNGWSTRGIDPPNQAPTLIELFFSPTSYASLPGIDFAFTPDLSAATYHTQSPLTDAPNLPPGLPNLYRLSDLDAPEPQIQLLSDSAEPVGGGYQTNISYPNRLAAASTDLSHLAFVSPYDILGDGSFSGGANSLYEYVDGVGVRAVGRIPTLPATECDDDGGPPCEEAPSSEAGLSALGYSDEMISADGSRMLFKAPAGEEPGAIYMREDGERTYQLNASEKTTPDPPQPAKVWAMSADGSRVFFTTGEQLVDDDDDGGGYDLYMYEVDKPAGSRLSLLSVSGTSDPGAAVTGVVGSSADGRYVYFTAGGQFVAGEPTSFPWGSYVDSGLYLWHDGAISYIGAFFNSAVARYNTLDGSWVGEPRKVSRVSPDGRSLLFVSLSDPGFAGRGGFAGYDHGNSCPNGGNHECRELYLYSADSGRLTCVSCNPNADVATGDANTDVIGVGIEPGNFATAHLSHALSEDGRRVFFTTPEALVSEDTNGVADAYEYDVPSATAHLISSGTSSTGSYFLDASPDGSDVFFATRERLVGWDIDSSYDLYDARIDGGFPEPAPVPAPCEGESCKPAPQAAPGAAPSASQNAGPGNRAPACPKGSRRVRRAGKSRCVKKHKRVAKQKRDANTNRRAAK